MFQENVTKVSRAGVRLSANVCDVHFCVIFFQPSLVFVQKTPRFVAEQLNLIADFIFATYHCQMHFLDLTRSVSHILYFVPQSLCELVS